ncbi:AAA family ATPase [Candidatus Synechococcus calcipolaris G9]|uniref:AAA family ATPase n=1 Tax=Candidatus Synechococcus calcipolaris G9 TaxID=1497997 RepID=A0ABT6EXD2_9SYNE|nr:ParA family protein [Candidatus Synechococcus calcipolaris]MDG2990022.1 AAA family ATPase [Candidatus Synechococcus calcipolaris G9]
MPIQLPPIAPDETLEEVICQAFVQPVLYALGFGDRDIIRSFETGAGTVDFAAAYPCADDPPFGDTQKQPYLIVEVKPPAKRSRNTPSQTVPLSLEEGTAHQMRAIAQLKEYLFGPNCQSTQWGLITNGRHLQLFRRHGIVIYPVTPSLEIFPQGMPGVIKQLKQWLQEPPRALTVSVYNNKGGVGKTTTTINLGATLAISNQKVLLIDFDSQGDLSRSLELTPTETCLSQCLTEGDRDIYQTIRPFNLHIKSGQRVKTAHIFDVIPADSHLDHVILQTAIAPDQGMTQLREKIKPLQNDYDYILIDCPTQWLFFSKSGLYASDVVLIPTRHTDLSSLNNAARVIRQFIHGEMRQCRQDGGPLALPIFFNGAPNTGKAIEVAQTEIQEMIAKSSELIPYFWPQKRMGQDNRTVFNLPEYAIIARAAFARVPAVFKDKRVLGFYQNLVTEYFLDIADSNGDRP